MNQPAERLSFSPRPRWALWLLFLSLWSVGLLVPNPARFTDGWLSREARFLLAKGLHVVAYALLAVLSGWLRAPFRYRWMLLVFMSAHALGTEFGQRFVATRTGSWRDVLLDHLGVALGVVLTWRWWRAPADEDTPLPSTAAASGGAAPLE
jgi:VanZ family protein